MTNFSQVMFLEKYSDFTLKALDKNNQEQNISIARVQDLTDQKSKAYKNLYLERFVSHYINITQDKIRKEKGLNYQPTEKDINDVLEKDFGRDSVSSLRGGLSGAFDEEIRNIKEFNGFSKTSKMYEIKLNDQLAGFIIAEYIRDNIHIRQFIIDKKYENQGIGKIVINNIHNVFDSKNILLDTRTANSPAIGFYKKMGFQTILDAKGNNKPNDSELNSNYYLGLRRDTQKPSKKNIIGSNFIDDSTVKYRY